MNPACAEQRRSRSCTLESLGFGNIKSAAMSIRPAFLPVRAALLLAVILLLFSGPSQGGDTGAETGEISETLRLCAGMRQEIRGMQERMPFWIDSVTFLIGMNIAYHDETCHLTLEYLMDDTRLIAAMHEKWREYRDEFQTEEDMADFLNSTEGHALLREELKAFVRDNRIFSSLLEHSGFRIGAVYRFLDDRLDLVQVEMGSGTNHRF